MIGRESKSATRSNKTLSEPRISHGDLDRFEMAAHRAPISAERAGVVVRPVHRRRCRPPGSRWGASLMQTRGRRTRGNERADRFRGVARRAPVERARAVRAAASVIREHARGSHGSMPSIAASPSRQCCTTRWYPRTTWTISRACDRAQREHDPRRSRLAQLHGAQPLGVIARIGAFNHRCIRRGESRGALGRQFADRQAGRSDVVRTADRGVGTSVPPGVFNVVTGGRDAWHSSRIPASRRSD